MKNFILVKNKEEIFKKTKSLVKVDYKFFNRNFFEACEYDEQTNILGVNVIAYGVAKTRQWLNSPAVPYIEAFTDKENLEMQQELQKHLCLSEIKRLMKAKQEIRFHNTEYNIEGAGKNIRKTIKAFIENAVKYFVKNDIDPRGDKEEYREIYFYNMENCEVYLPKKYVDKIWDEIEELVVDEIREKDKTIKEEKANQEDIRIDYYSSGVGGWGDSYN